MSDVYQIGKDVTELNVRVTQLEAAVNKIAKLLQDEETK